MNLLAQLKEPWPWYVAGPLIGLMVPLLLIGGNKTFGISSSLRHVCAACFPGDNAFFRYDWKKEKWNLLFVLGALLGGLISLLYLKDPAPVNVNPRLLGELSSYGINEHDGLFYALFQKPEE